MEDFNYLPEEETEYTCNVCETPIDKPGVCSYKCYKVDMM